ncbi:zinc-containing alcohol dehydrogenase [Heterostelium album PN500]|uniref:Zinc-containing alcohol dehydrogenase n=1 Tax=Heterostelium pallidum (strain ATCC 26659 / Pp 5 / PN500) TaxID=670386 RepID=D3B8N8_HETP5|nr:zinc-containing alcohol dehydrogenase [Heterostelium album PN500]EFA82406.1 zinc-containing alcohol dehydrogenase [Heterostelium album PN500]|eukprot:XP_020434523.1 zinc-containing alcohol dehydrogenase [Heterostelium album PN500]
MSMKCAVFPEKGGAIKITTVPIPEPKDGEVRIKVMACGVCHSDLLIQNGYSTSYPRIPGHEVAGIIDKIGKGVDNFKVGDKVGVGWFGGCCHEVNACDDDDWVCCAKGKACGSSYDGGYAEYCCAPHDALARIPEGMSFEKAGPLLCAGITVFNGIRNQHVKAGSLVCIQGIGGLGHLAIQFAKRLGYEVVAFSSGADKEALAIQLGAKHYIDGSQPDAIKRLTKMAPMMVVITGPSKKAVESLIPTIHVGGKLLLLAALPEPFSVDGTALLSKKVSIVGWPSGDSRDSQDTMKFSLNNGVEAMTETFPLEKAVEALQKMESGKVRFRAVLVMKQ